MSLKAIGILVFLSVFVGGLFYLTRATSPGLVAQTALKGEATKEAEPESGTVSLPQARRPGRNDRTYEGSFKAELAQVDALVRAGQAQEALHLLESILQKDPKHERALEEMGMLHLTEFQDPDKAAGYFKKALTTNPNNEFAVMELVGISLSPEKAASMADYLRGLYETNPSSPVLADGLGELYLSQGRFGDAVQFLEKSAQDTKYAEFAYTRLGSVYEQMGESDKAIDYYRKAITHQAAELEKKKNDGQSTELLSADLARSQLDIAHLLIKEGRCEEAKEALERARRGLGNNFEVQAIADQIRGDSCST